MCNYAYIRVSSREQNVARQVEAMLEIGIKKKDMFIDKQSGKDFNREKYQKLLRRLKSTDVVYIKSIDRLGRNYRTMESDYKRKNADIFVLDFPLLNTTNQVGGVTGKFLADLVLQILSYVAQIERENIKQRQAEGIRVAKRNGVRFGRPEREIPEEFDRIYELWKNEKISKREAARQLHTNHNTFSNWIKRQEKIVVEK